MKEIVKLIIKAQKASPKPPIGSILGQKGINVSKFCKDFNLITKKYEENSDIPTEILIKRDKTFKIFVKSPTTSFLIKKFSSDLKKKIINKKYLKKIYKIKKSDINSIKKKKIIDVIKGSIKSMGFTII